MKNEQKKYNNLMTSYTIFFIYFGVLLLGGVIINMILSKFLSNKTEINTLMTFIDSLVILGLFVAIPQTRKVLVNDALKFKKNLKRNVIITIILALSFTVISYGVQKIIFLFISDTSDNQAAVVSQFTGKYAILALFSSVLFAPIMEEMIFRKGIYLAFNKDKLSFWISSLLFAGIHILSTNPAEVGAKNYILLILTYLVPSFMLNIIYRFFGHNIYMTIIAHFLNNVLAFILVCIAGKFVVG